MRCARIQSSFAGTSFTSRIIGLEPEWICVWRARPGVLRPQRRHRARLAEPDEGVELLRQRSLRVVAHQLGLRPVYHPDKALQPRFQEPPPQRFVPPLCEVEQEAWDACVMTEPLVAVA